jgi:hypothetical protein
MPGNWSYQVTGADRVTFHGTHTCDTRSEAFQWVLDLAMAKFKSQKVAVDFLSIEPDDERSRQGP